MANASEHGFLKDKKNREDTTRLNGSVIKQMYIYIYIQRIFLLRKLFR